MTERKREPKITGLVGRGFHTIEDNGSTCWQGSVIADLGDGYFLVQLYSWIIGESSTQHILHISEMAELTPNKARRFRFFDSLEDANTYMDTTAHYRDEAIRSQKKEDQREPATLISSSKWLPSSPN
jgi:hypothetical protein